jgi:hypothetical protein
LQSAKGLRFFIVVLDDVDDPLARILGGVIFIGGLDQEGRIRDGALGQNVPHPLVGAGHDVLWFATRALQGLAHNGVWRLGDEFENHAPIVGN